MTQTIVQNAEESFNAFLSLHAQRFLDYAHVPIEETELIHDYKNYPLELTHFDDIYDTLMYSKLIEKAIALHPGARAVIDLGAGSSIPSLLAVKNSGRKNVRAIAVDIDPEAKNIGMKNAATLGLSDRYEFISCRMEEALQRINLPETIVVSNPPYIPTPESISDFHFVPINGGAEGTDYMLKILQREYPRGSVLALLWGSLTTPNAILPLIEEKFEVLHVEAMKIHFGHYTGHPEIYSHLCKLKDEGKVVFGDDKTQIVIGTILRAK